MKRFSITNAGFMASVAQAAGGAFSPLDIDDLEIWLDASDLSTINGGSVVEGGNVSAWNDKSGNGNHFTQGVALDQPVYQATGFNNLKTVFADSGTAGRNKGLLSNYDLSVSSAFTLIIIGKRGSVMGGYPEFFGTYLVSDPINCLAFGQTPNNISIIKNFFGDNPTAMAGFTTTPGGLYIRSGNYNGITYLSSYGTPEINITPTVMQSLAPGNTSLFSIAGGNLDANTRGDFYFSEVLFYRRNVSGIDLTNLKTYLSDKWGVTI